MARIAPAVVPPVTRAIINPALPKPCRLAKPPPGKSGADLRARSPAKRAPKVPTNRSSRATASCASMKAPSDRPDTSRHARFPTRALTLAISTASIPGTSTAIRTVNQRGQTSTYQVRCPVEDRDKHRSGTTDTDHRATRHASPDQPQTGTDHTTTQADQLQTGTDQATAGRRIAPDR